MSWSLNEIEGLARKAARGAGLDWGLAEEAGKATRWLCAAGWPGADLLAGLLTRNQGVAYDRIRPISTDGTWQARSGMLCPLAAGAALCDRAWDWADGQSATLGPTAMPLLLVPYMAWSADRTGAILHLGFQGVSITRGHGETGVDVAEADALTCAAAASVALTPVKTVTGAPLRRAYRGEIGAEAARTLLDFAQKTYAPDTEQSRLSGAGAGLTDND